MTKNQTSDDRIEPPYMDDGPAQPLDDTRAARLLTMLGACVDDRDSLRKLDFVTHTIRESRVQLAEIADELDYAATMICKLLIPSEGFTAEAVKERLLRMSDALIIYREYRNRSEKLLSGMKPAVGLTDAFRDAVLEEAAKLCDLEFADPLSCDKCHNYGPSRCAEAIRALKGKDLQQRLSELLKKEHHQ